jgi:hypothetical protein
VQQSRLQSGLPIRLPPVLSLGKRAAESLIVLLALYAAVFVPLGERTLWQHACAILGTPEAQRAGRELTIAGGRMLRELSDFQARPVRGKPQVPDLPRRSRPGPSNNDDEP